MDTTAKIQEENVEAILSLKSIAFMCAKSNNIVNTQKRTKQPREVEAQEVLTEIPEVKRGLHLALAEDKEDSEHDEPIMLSSDDDETFMISSDDDETIMIPSDDNETIMIPSDDDETIMIPSDDDETVLIPSDDDDTIMIPSDESLFAGTSSNKTQHIRWMPAQCTACSLHRGSHYKDEECF